MRFGFVTPRYGAAVIGGAEFAMRMLGEHLVEAGHSVEVFTTTALDAATWAEAIPAGSVTEAGVVVHRFPIASGRSSDFDAMTARVLARADRTSMADASAWVDAQGPVSPRLIDAIADADVDCLALSPYLYHPIVHGAAAARVPVILHPAAHDEPPLRLTVYRALLNHIDGLVFYTHGERQLLEERHGVAARLPQVVLGLGVDEGVGDASEARGALGLGDRPFIVCVGRVDDGKGTEMLVRFFATYKQRRRGPLALVLIGPVLHQPTSHPDVMVAGRVDESVKWGAMASAELLVSPSGYESFSFVTLEAWSAGTPVLVNGRCGATREHAERSGGGLWFEDYPTFESALDRMLGDRRLRSAMAQNGRAYVADGFRWPDVVRRYAHFVASRVEHQ